ncbi:hypothetical protein ABPG77_008859 [Micractinium sp. CCAP 211/92]
MVSAAPASGAPQSRSLPVPHIQQAYNWDCGLACVLMVLRALGMRQCHFGMLLDLCPTRSIWTIDLAHLLAKCGAAVQMLTVTIGANQAYSGEQFYAETMKEDVRRVNALFQAAPDAGFSVQKRSLPLAQLRSLLLGGGCLLIALVDKVRLASGSLATHSRGGLGSVWSPEGMRRSGRLSHEGGSGAAAAASRAASCLLDTSWPDGCVGDSVSSTGAAAAQQAAAARALEAAAAGERAGSTAAAGASGREAAALEPAAAAGEGSRGGDSGYLGHYIVLCGYDARSDEFELQDPASDRPRLWITAARLEEARKCFGTDEDLLLVEIPASHAHATGDGVPGAAGEQGAGAAVPREGAAARTGATTPRPVVYG